ncbi:ribosome silencing factor [Novipirellula sp. SH528]|uniref:ribosome silencing factor n=1 Tax=Novipirellula sp. SH528 TaxID=3454466 RepID=UPI003FA080E5|tara:strand:- start:577 stop:1101 length:525 start_codon:yes stop_codon:yes gene_type:complete
MTENANETAPDADDSLPTPNSSENASKTTPPEDAAPFNPMLQPSRAIRPHGVEYSRKLAAAAAQVALDNKGQDVMVLDVCGQTAEFDLFVLATGSSRRQLHAISEQIDDVLEKSLGDERLGIEGYQDSRWIVLDYGSVVIHLFDEETRDYYDLESLWADGKKIPLEELGLKPNA